MFQVEKSKQKHASKKLIDTLTPCVPTPVNYDFLRDLLLYFLMLDVGASLLFSLHLIFHYKFRYMIVTIIIIIITLSFHAFEATKMLAAEHLLECSLCEKDETLYGQIECYPRSLSLVIVTGLECVPHLCNCLTYFIIIIILYRILRITRVGT